MRKASTLFLLVAVFCLAITGTAFAGHGGGGTGGGTITGVVKNITTGAAMSGVTVSNGTVSGVTNASGVYTLAACAVGVNTLSTTVSGYLQTWQVATVVLNTTTTINWALTANYPTNAMPTQTGGLAVFAWNDLGMHCDQDSYKYACVLPPYNTLHVQIKDQNSKSGFMPAGLTVSYAFAKKTNSTLHTDFWTYAVNFHDSGQPGWALAANVGLKGNGLTGTFVADAANKSWVAEGIPVTPYDDDGTWDPYGAATLTVKKAGVTVTTVQVVTPVSTEMTCSNCHGTTNPFADILTKHDTLQGTTLLADANAGHPHLCGECHQDNALGTKGVTGNESLSVAMHKRHDGKVTNDVAGCYNCHPGPRTLCMRGIMARAGKGCPDCHGSLNKLWTSAATGGRQPWLNEPKCADCHDAKHAENAGTLYRNSLITNSPNAGMNNAMYCESCHNGTHAEYTTSNSADTVVTQKVQGNNYWIYACASCHPGKSVSKMHN